MGTLNESQSGIVSGIKNAVTRTAGLLSLAVVGGLATHSYEAAEGDASFGELAPSKPPRQRHGRRVRNDLLGRRRLSLLGALVATRTLPLPARCIA